ncbi:MAG: TSUP family transporter [Oscillibacter sp.]|nr:TSUP family transporter [Oscillibacter sp.]
MKTFLPAFLCALGAGVLSSWGVGGGTLLLLVMTLFLGVEQKEAQGVNLLFFLPAAASSLFFHAKNDCLDRPTLRAALLPASLAALAASLLSSCVDTEALRRPFGVYLLLSALLLFSKRKNETPHRP